MEISVIISTWRRPSKKDRVSQTLSAIIESINFIESISETIQGNLDLRIKGKKLACRNFRNIPKIKYCVKDLLILAFVLFVTGPSWDTGANRAPRENWQASKCLSQPHT